VAGVKFGFGEDVLEAGVLCTPVLVRVTTGADVLEAGAEPWWEAGIAGLAVPLRAGSLPACSCSARNWKTITKPAAAAASVMMKRLRRLGRAERARGGVAWDGAASRRAAPCDPWVGLESVTGLGSVTALTSVVALTAAGAAAAAG
jgi:hypothetical protein